MLQYTKNVLLSLITLLFIPALLFAQNQDRSFTWTADDEQLEWGACPEFMPDSCRIAVLQGDPSEPDADVLFKMKENTTIPNHWHHSAERMVLVTGEMEVKYEGEEVTELKPGTYAFGPPEKPHEASCTSDEECVLFIAFSKPVDAFAVK